MSYHEHEAIPQCPEAGCAGWLLNHLRGCGVRMFLSRDSAALFRLDEGLLAHSWTERAKFEINRHTKEIAAHRHRIALLLVAEMGGRN